MTISKLVRILFAMTAIGCVLYETQSLAAPFSKSVKVRAGAIIENQKSSDNFFQIYTAKLNNKEILKISGDDCNCFVTGIKYGPIAIGNDDIVFINTGSAANGAPYDVFYTLIINKNGEVKLPKVYDIDGKEQQLDGFIGCNSDEGFSEPKLDGNKITTTCIEMDGRRKKTFKYTYENNVFRVSR